MAAPITEKHLVGEAERLAVRTRAAKHRLVIVVAHRVPVGERFENRCVAVLHVEERHRLPGVMWRAGRRRAVRRRDRRLQIMQTACRVILDTCSLSIAQSTC
jgi:hypothetical protein